MLDHKKQQQLQQLDRKQMKALFQGLEFVDDNQTTRQSHLPADPMDRLDPRQRDFVNHWQPIVARSDQGLARQFIQQAPHALARMDFAGVERWLLQALENFDKRGLGWAQQVLMSVDQFAAIWSERSNSLSLSDVVVLLKHLVTGLGGRELRFVAADQAYTDTESVYLPTELTIGNEDDSNFRLFKALAVHHWAQTWYGTWHWDVVQQLLAIAPENQAEKLVNFAALERLRLDACIARDLPGVWRDMQALHERIDQPLALIDIWSVAAQELSQLDASAQDSLRWSLQLGSNYVPAPACYHGQFRVERVQSVLQARLQKERKRLRVMLGKLQQELVEESKPISDKTERHLLRSRKPTESFSLSQQPAQQGSDLNVRLYLEERPIAIPSDMEQVLGSIVQDLGVVPDEYFHPGGQKPYIADLQGADDMDDSNGAAAPAEYLTDNVVRYPEWDYQRQRFRPQYCMLREHTVTPAVIDEEDDFILQTLTKYHVLLKSIRRTFEAILGEQRRQRRQSNGDDIDIDALVAAHADACHGEELSERVYTQLANNERSIAVMMMVDMSGSTKGWVNEAEREALVLLCEALKTIGDQYAIYGFSGRTHRRVDIYHIKRFDEPYNQLIQRRISAIQPHAYTRMGAPLRYLGSLLSRIPARHRLLITLSDGKPEDYGSYYGRYGIEDTRHALLELRHSGIHPFCITIDKEGGDYLPYMYGDANFSCIDEVAKLPLKVAEIYRRLTT